MIECHLLENKRQIVGKQKKGTFFLRRFLFFEPLVGFEPTTPRLQITCSGQLS